MLKFQTQVYRINDILGWDERKELFLVPNFQRRRVWSPRGKSFLMDSIIRGYPLPQFFIREKINTKERKTIREVVDGQQRLRTILEFINGEFTIMPIHNEEFANIVFQKLPDEIQQGILSFPLAVNTLIGTSDEDVLEIFSRLNSYSVPLNQQELINANYVGVFKQKIDYLSRLNLAYWEENRILSKWQFARMKEAEFTAELVIAMINGLQNGKKIIDNIYETYDDGFPQFGYIEPRFNDTIELCKIITDNSIGDTEFKRLPLFYSLFCAIYDLKYGLKSESNIAPKKINDNLLSDTRQKIYQLNQAITGEVKSEKFKDFVSASKSSTDKLANRQKRHQILIEILNPLFS